MKAIFDQIRKLMQPAQWASWQTLIFLSIFSALTAALTSPAPPQIAERIISSFGWVFLILGTWWFVYEPEVKKKLKLYELFVGPWIVGALICVYLFGTWEGRAVPTPTAFVSWPPISTIVWSVPKFITTNPKTKSPLYTTPTPANRQNIILVLLANLVISCWFQFYFVVQNWLVEYPSFRAQGFEQSAFVRELQPSGQRVEFSRGVDLLDAAEKSVKQRLEGKPWAQVERWLSELDQEFPAVRNEAFAQLPQIAENQLWNLDGRVVSDAYDLELHGIWQGPSARTDAYFLTKTCRIAQSQKAAPPQQLQFSSPAPPAVSLPQTQAFGTVQCGAASSPDFLSTPETDG
ncbi:DUF5357 family protein [Myxacorys almedinensis]|uniref:DUF5357 domain-containing protein n=1 Tax=Myxacorys almedinensis A TaxID=2690445 RepID=A0A8J7Z206_9CYAN|nr:DUF5357 family protein [Myxacorys almedinensis]NDJ16688.1 hypothetical protein [Myxacorys almedinensis A]